MSYTFSIMSNGNCISNRVGHFQRLFWGFEFESHAAMWFNWEPIRHNAISWNWVCFFKVFCLYTIFDAKQKFMQIRTCVYHTTCCGNSRLDTKISLIAPSIIVCFNIFSYFYIEATE